MHTLYFVFVRHFTSLSTCFDPCGSSSGQTCKVTYKNKIKSVHLLATKFTTILMCINVIKSLYTENSVFTKSNVKLPLRVLRNVLA
jgi:hypothetical protein